MAVDAVQAMDLAQAMQTIRWLDEERRKDKELIGTLQQRLQNQAQEIAQQQVQIQELLTRIASIQTSLTRMDDFEGMVANFKSELTYQMDYRDETRRKESAESERLRRIEYEALTDHLHRLERELQVLPRYDEELTARRAEESRLSELTQRLAEQVADLSKRLDERLQVVVYLEEQRRADNRRITELEQDLPELFKRIDAVARRIPLLEDAQQKQKARIEEAVQAVSKYEKPIEELRISDFQREQRMKQYLDQGEAVAKELERVRAQTQGFLEQQQEVKRYLRVLDAFQARQEKQQTEVSEMQRLAEERLRRQWEEWQTARDKQLKKQEALIEERWRRQESLNDDFRRRFDALTPVLELHQRQLETLWNTRLGDATTMLKAAQNIYDALIAPIDDQLATLRGDKPANSKG